MISKILISQDKANHAIYGAITFGVVYVIMMLTQMFPQLAAMNAALIASIAVGVGKEAYDYYINKKSGEARHEVSEADIFATALGGVFCYLVLVV